MVKKALNLSRVALAKVNSVVAGTITTIDARVSPMAQSLGISFNSANSITENITNNRLDTAELNISDLQTRLANLENRLLNYENHTHSYIDDTITDTSDGSGSTVSTGKTTGVVS